MMARKTILRLVASVAVAASCSLVVGVTPTRAALVEACPGVTSVSFQYPLTTGFASGTATMTYGTVACADAGAGVVYEGSSVYIPPTSWSPTTGYSGSCLLASMSPPFYGRPGLLIGGSVLIGEPGVGATWGEVHVLLPLSPCNEFSAVGVGSPVGVF
jgi:hypothetical protein